MSQDHPFSSFADLLTQVEQKRAQFQAELQLLTGVDWRVSICTHPVDGPHTQQLCDAGKELGWVYTEQIAEWHAHQPYDEVRSGASVWGCTTIYGPFRDRSAE